MAGGRNTTGVPRTVDYHLGKGRVYVSPLDSDGLPLAYRHLGNVPDLTVSADTEQIDHFSSMVSKKTIDRRIVFRNDFTVKMKPEEFNFDNLAMAVLGTVDTTVTNAAVAGFADREIAAEVELGRWYELVDDNGVRARNIDAEDVTATEAGGPTALVEGTDYTLDLIQGMIFIKSDATNIAPGEALNVALAAKAGAGTVHRVSAGKVTEVLVALKFVSMNVNDLDADGNAHETEWQFGHAIVTIDGDLSMIGDEVAGLPLTCACGQDINGDTLTIETVPTT